MTNKSAREQVHIRDLEEALDKKRDSLAIIEEKLRAAERRITSLEVSLSGVMRKVYKRLEKLEGKKP